MISITARNKNQKISNWIDILEKAISDPSFIRFARKTSAFRPVMNSANTEGVLAHS
jgi:hypothetical protein